MAGTFLDASCIELCIFGFFSPLLTITGKLILLFAAECLIAGSNMICNSTMLSDTDFF